MTIATEDVPQAAARFLPSLLAKYLPNATWMFGSFWSSPSPRADADRQYARPNDMQIEKDGRFHDQCTGVRGDVVGLMAYFWKCSRDSAANRLAGMISPNDMLLDQPVRPNTSIDLTRVDRKLGKAERKLAGHVQGGEQFLRSLDRCGITN